MTIDIRSPRLFSGVASARRSSQRGVSLVESLIATLLLAFVAISLFPLFHQSVASNLSGSDSNQATHHTLSELERLLALPFDSQVFEMSDAGRLPDHTIEVDGSGEKMVMGTLYYDPSAKADQVYDPNHPLHHIAPGEWIANRTDATSPALWSRTSVIRQYSYADIASVIDASNPGQIISEGHPNLFDSPLRRDALDGQVNFVEEDVAIESLRTRSPGLETRLVKVF